MLQKFLKVILGFRNFRRFIGSNSLCHTPPTEQPYPPAQDARRISLFRRRRELEKDICNNLHSCKKPTVSVHRTNLATGLGAIESDLVRLIAPKPYLAKCFGTA